MNQSFLTIDLLFVIKILRPGRKLGVQTGCGLELVESGIVELALGCPVCWLTSGVWVRLGWKPGEAGAVGWPGEVGWSVAGRLAGLVTWGLLGLGSGMHDIGFCSSRRDDIKFR